MSWKVNARKDRLKLLYAQVALCAEKLAVHCQPGYALRAENPYAMLIVKRCRDWGWVGEAETQGQLTHGADWWWVAAAARRVFAAFLAQENWRLWNQFVDSHSLNRGHGVSCPWRSDPRRFP